MPGSNWKVEFLDVAYKQFLDLPENIRFQVGRKIVALESDPRPSGCKKLQGHVDLYRLRSGDFRVVYRVDRERRLIEIVRVRNRKEAYRGL